jgi:hypothetical protein
VMTGQDNGSVYAYNYASDAGYNTPDWLMPLININHDYSFANLYEGNDSSGISADNVHGTGAAETVFRNRLRGQDTPAKSNSLVAVADDAYNRAENFVANVLGTPGAETKYQSTSLEPSGYIWNVNAQAEHYSVQNDPAVSQTLFRWGNYDTVTGATRWCGDPSNTGWSTTCASSSEVPTSDVDFIDANLVPSTTTLPASLYLSSQPAFWQTAWGMPPWPAIGPDVTCQSAPGQNCQTPSDGIQGYSYYIPAQLCALNTPFDPAYQHSFAINGASWSGGTVTLTTATNTLQKFDTVTISGVSPAAYDGVYELTSATATSVSFALPTNPGKYASGGTVQYPNVLLYNAANCYPAAYTTNGVHLVTTLQSLTFDSSLDIFVATLNIKNTGSAEAKSVALTTASLGVTQANGPYPIDSGNVAVGNTVTDTVRFPAASGGAGEQTVLEFTETYTGGSVAAGILVVLP